MEFFGPPPPFGPGLDWAWLVAEVRQELLRATDIALAAGVRAIQLIWDPGLGFAKTRAETALLAGLAELPPRSGFPCCSGPFAQNGSSRCSTNPGPEPGCGARARLRPGVTPGHRCAAVADVARLFRPPEIDAIVRPPFGAA